MCLVPQCSEDAECSPLTSPRCFFHHTSFRMLTFTPRERTCVMFGYHRVRNKLTWDGAEDFFSIQQCLKLWEGCEWDDKNDAEANGPADKKQLRKWEGLCKFRGGKICENFFPFPKFSLGFEVTLKKYILYILISPNWMYSYLVPENDWLTIELKILPPSCSPTSLSPTYLFKLYLLSVNDYLYMACYLFVLF